MYSVNGTRVNQKAALMAGLGFLGGLVATLEIVDPIKLKFKADVEYTTGNVGTPIVKVTPCNEDGSHKVFANIDDLLMWCRTAFNSNVISFEVNVPDINVLNKPFVLPANPVADATRQRTGWQKAKENSQARIADLNEKLTAQAGLGYNLPTANPLAQAAYADTQLKIATVGNYITFYDSEIARLTLIINA